jgi:putative Mn2+ efflux pump MntP
MSTNVAIIGVLLGLDSLAVGMGLGAVIPDWRRRCRLAFSFGVCDGLASLIGSTVGMDRVGSALLWGEWLGPAAAAFYGLYVLYLTWRCQDLTTNPGTARWLVFALPICLSLDNLLAGVGTEASGLPAVLGALAFAGMSGALALLGIGAGSALVARVRFRAGWLSGAFLILGAAGLVLKDALIDLTVNI